MKFGRKAIIFATCLAIISTMHVSAAGSTTNSQTVSWSLQNALNENQSQAADMTAKLNALEKEINDRQTEVSKLNDEIAKDNTEIEREQTAFDNERNLMFARMRAVYMNGSNDSFISLLLSSNNFSDFLEKKEFLSKLSNYESNLLNSMKKTMDELANTKADVQNKQNQLSKESLQLIAEKSALDTQLEVKNQQIANEQQELQAATIAREQQNGNSDNYNNLTPGLQKIDASVAAFEPVVAQYAAQYGMSAYINLILAVIQQESDGAGNDVMQSLALVNVPQDSNTSIQYGIRELKSCIEAAGVQGPSDIPNIEIALQGYNFGGGYITWAQKNGGYTLENAKEFATAEMKILGWGNYGDVYYVPHVLRYYTA